MRASLDPPLGHQVEQDLHALLPAELVGACVDDELHATVRVEVLHAPRAGREHLVADVVVVHQLPVRDDHAVVPELLAQQAGDDLAVVAEADLLDLLAVDLEPDRHAVVGHDRRGSRIDDGRERLEVVREPATWVDLFAAVGEVGVLAVLLRAAAGEVLARARDAARAELRPAGTP